MTVYLLAVVWEMPNTRARWSGSALAVSASWRTRSRRMRRRTDRTPSCDARHAGETGHQLLMRALAARGDAAAALAAYDQLRQLLREELGVSPCPATQTLPTRLLRGQVLDEPTRPVTHPG